MKLCRRVCIICMLVCIICILVCIICMLVCIICMLAVLTVLVSILSASTPIFQYFKLSEEPGGGGGAMDLERYTSNLRTALALRLQEHLKK